MHGCINDNLFIGLIRQARLLVNNYRVLPVFLCAVSRGFAGRLIRAKDISNYATKGGSNCLATTPQPAGYPDGVNLLGATSKKVRLYANSVSCIRQKLRSLRSSVRLVWQRPL